LWAPPGAGVLWSDHHTNGGGGARGRAPHRQARCSARPRRGGDGTARAPQRFVERGACALPVALHGGFRHTQRQRDLKHLQGQHGAHLGHLQQARIDPTHADETSLRRGRHYITVVHDLDTKWLLFAAAGRDHQTVLDFAADLKAHSGDPAEVRHVCMDMSAAYAKGAGMALPQADISYDRST